MKKTLLLVIVAFVVSAVPALAQSEKGDSEVLFNGMLANTWFKGFETTEWMHIGSMNFQYGYYATSTSQIGFGTNFTFYSSSFGSGIDYTINGLAFYKYYFTAGQKSAPYFIAQFYFPISETENWLDNTFTQIGFGTKYFMTRNIAFDMNFTYGFSMGAISDYGMFLTTFGFAYVF